MYTGITPEKLSQLKRQAEDHRLKVQPDPYDPFDSNRYMIHKLTITAQFQYDPTAQNLTIVISGLGALAALRKMEKYGDLKPDVGSLS
jgi:hypothetical protein